MKYISLTILMLLSTLFGKANDGVYYASGSGLVPVQETDISVAKEILTITIGKDSFAIVDVYYEFMNNSDTKTVKMAFEAPGPDEELAPLNNNGIHPFIHDFTVMMNGEKLSHENAVIADTLSPKPELLVEYSYAYYFDATFKKGKNIVHHTYRYHMGYTSEEKFRIMYRLSPATRWANHQIDDFTLRIKTEDHTSYYLPGELWKGSSFVMYPDGQDKIFCYGEGSCVFVDFQAPSQYMEWHTENFRPEMDLAISSPECVYPHKGIYPNCAWVVENDKGEVVGRLIGDCGDSYFIEVQDYGRVPKDGHKAVEYRAKDGKGCVWISSEVKYTIKNGEKMQIVNVRALPSMKSSIIGTIDELYGDLPTAVDCLGYVPSVDDNSRDKWYKVDIDGKVGYVRADLMYWNSMNTF